MCPVFPELSGAYADYVVAPEHELAAMPPGGSYLEAAGSMVALTAWVTLFEHGRLGVGERVLVHGPRRPATATSCTAWVPIR